MAEYVLRVSEIDEAGKDYAFPVRPAWLSEVLADASLRPAGNAAGSLALHAQRNGREILVNGTLRADLLTECCRCLGDAPVTVDAELVALLTPAGDMERPEVEELSEEDLDRLEFSGNEVVLDELVREHLVLEVPMQPLCSEDCGGIEVPEQVRPPAEVFGTSEEPVDPRLAPLRALKQKLPPDKE